MKLVATVDDDGHFHLALLDEREKVYKLLHDIEYGDFMANQDEPFPENYQKLNVKEWRDLISGYEERGRMEIVEIKDETI